MIQLRALGVLDLRAGDDAEIRQVLAQPKRAALLTYLVLAAPRGPHPRDLLLAMFWPDQEPESARNALSQAVHFLRRALGDEVIVSRNGDALETAPSAIWCDAIAFDEATRQGRVDEALALYRGDFLEGFHIANAPDFERWLDSERQRLGATFDAALETVAARCEQQGDHAAALTHRRRLAARAPYNSGVVLRYMRALAASGDTAAAMQHALVHEKLLRQELDVALPADIAAFVAELQQRPASLPVKRLSAGPVVATERGAIKPGHSGDRGELPDRFWRVGRQRVAVLTAALVMACVGVAYAVVARETADDSLMELYQRGQNAQLNRSQAGVQTAAQYYRLAIERDSNFALGSAGLSQAYEVMAFYHFAPKAVALDSARILAERAVKLDSALPEARTALAMSLANSGHFGSAEQEFLRAIEQNPGNAGARTSYGILLVALGRGEEALAQAERALNLDPLGPRVHLSVKGWATFLITGQRAGRTQPTTERRPILKVEPGEPWSRAQMAVDLAQEGRCDEAWSDLARAQRLVPDSSMPMLAHAGNVHWWCDRRTEARELLARMTRRADASDHGLRVAILHATFGERDSAFVWLDRHRWMVAELAMLRAAPGLDSLRSDPRFPELLRRIGVR